MIWLGYAGLSLMFLLLALHTLRKARVNEKTLDELKKNAITLFYKHPPRDPLELFEGPARLELFGHVIHVGWVRQGPERIDVLTIEGEALQCDARSRYRLTPLTWSEFVGECLRRKEEGIERFGHEIEALKEARAESEARRGALRIAISDALEAFNEWANSPEIAASMANKGIQILDAAREKDDKYDELPF